MTNRTDLKDALAHLPRSQFKSFLREVYKFQLSHNKIFKDYVAHLSDKSTLEAVYLPISAFKSRTVTSLDSLPQSYFESSGTTTSVNSKHYYDDLSFYLKNARGNFEQFYGDIGQYCVLALLPHYLERQNSSLVAMIHHFIEHTRYPQSGFYLHDLSALKYQLIECKNNKIPTILFGVSFALLDFAQFNPISFEDLIIIETGGMKGRRTEVTRQDLHNQIRNGFGTQHIHSEYGMTELFSQAYAKENGRFYPPCTMIVDTVELNDPFTKEQDGKTGIIRIIDLANIDSCSFIITEDIGKSYSDGSFTVDGRLDLSEMRGCNLLYEGLEEN